MTELLIKFEPIAVSVKAAPPAVALAGEIDVSTGTGFPTVKAIASDAPPPGPGFTTFTSNDPIAERSVAGICAVRVVAFAYVVVNEAPPHSICEALVNPVPTTVSVNAAPPAGALVGEIDVSAGTGFPTVKAMAFDAPPPGAGFTTFTSNDPIAERSVAGICAVRVVAFEYAVVNEAPLH